MDEFYQAHGRYMTHDERAELVRASDAKPLRAFSTTDKARLEQLVREAAGEVRSEYPDVALDEFEQLVRRRLEGWRDHKGHEFFLVHGGGQA